MRPKTRLKLLRMSAFKSLTRLEDQAVSVSRFDSIRQVDRTMAHVSINLLNTWSNFSRAYYLSSILNPKTEGGYRITVNPAIPSFDDARRMAVNCYRRHGVPLPPGTPIHRREEPTWHDNNVLMRTCQELGHSNLAHIRSAFSGNTKTLVNLPIFRNYFAHRNQGTKSAALASAQNVYSIVETRPAFVLVNSAPGSRNMLVLDWLDDIKLIIEYLCL